MTTDASHFLDLFRYNDWANQRVIAALRTAALVEEAHTQALRWLSHLLRAQDIWLGRVLGGEEALTAAWDVDGLAACTERSERSTAAWLVHLAACDEAEFRQHIAYTNTKGVGYSSTLREIATHVVNHSTHHRGQILALLRQQGHVPPPLDYIFFVR